MAFDSNLFMNYRMPFSSQTSRTRHRLTHGLLHRILHFLMRNSRISHHNGFMNDANTSYHLQIFFMHMLAGSSWPMDLSRTPIHKPHFLMLITARQPNKSWASLRTATFLTHLIFPYTLSFVSTRNQVVFLSINVHVGQILQKGQSIHTFINICQSQVYPYAISILVCMILYCNTTFWWVKQSYMGIHTSSSHIYWRLAQKKLQDNIIKGTFRFG
jgi:hypothetical protein